MNYYRVVKIAVNFAAILILTFSIYFYYLGDVFRGNAGIVSFLAILTPSFIYKKTWIQRVFHSEALSAMEAIVTTGVILNSLGAVWLYYESRFMSYDTLVHFINPILLCMGAAIAYLLHAEFLNKKSDKCTATIFGLMATVLIIFGWELFEILGDRAWGSIMSIQVGDSYDAITDLMAGLISLPIGATIVYKYFDFIKKRLKK